jgi:myosin heavy subunit
MEKFKSNDAFDFTVGNRIKGSHLAREEVKDCGDCFLLMKDLAECKKLLSQTEKKNKFLSAQKNDLMKEVMFFKESLKEVKKDAENDRKVVGGEKKDLEIKRLKEELKKTQNLLEEVTKEYDSFSINMSQIPHFDDFDQAIREKEEIIREKNQIIQEKDEIIQEKEEIIQEKQEKIQEKEEIIREKQNSLLKAQASIKKLNEECENYEQKLLETTNFNSSNDLRALQKKYNDLKAKNFEETEKLTLKIEQLSEEKWMIESAFEELSQKFLEIEKITLKRMEDFSQNLETLQNLEENLKSKEKIIENQKKLNQDLEISKQLELDSLKKTASLAFENFSKKSSEPSDSLSKKFQFKSKNLTQALKELLFWFTSLQRYINLVVERESEVIAACVKSFDKKTENFRADFEKWVMRNEELEQRLVSVESNNLKFIRVIADLQKIVFAKDRQFDEVVRMYSGIGKEMQSTIDFLSVELSDKQAIIVKEFLPSAFQMFRRANENLITEVYRRRC